MGSITAARKQSSVATKLLHLFDATATEALSFLPLDVQWMNSPKTDPSS
jgi:hypothetical protein